MKLSDRMTISTNTPESYLDSKQKLILQDWITEVRKLEAVVEAVKYLAVDCESGMIETEADEKGLISREEHDHRIALRMRRALVALDD